MATAEATDLVALYLKDETAWLELMSALAASGRAEDMDLANLSEYLSDMARRDRREVHSRLVVLLTHLLKWDHQAERRGGSWRGTIREQKRELRMLLESRTLHRHAERILIESYAAARLQAADETEMAIEVFPSENAWDLARLLADLDG